MRWQRRLARKSWWLAKLVYARHGLSLEGRPEELVWYFAFGSNLHASAFLERRKMVPTSSRIGRLPDYRLRFNLDGYPRGRSAPANIAPSPGEEVWGVLYQISRSALVTLDSTEGVPGGNYRHLWVNVESPDDGVVPAVTYIANGKPNDGRPSLRYITLIREGARAHGLPPHWLAMLDGVQHAE